MFFLIKFQLFAQFPECRMFYSVKSISFSQSKFAVFDYDNITYDKQILCAAFAYKLLFGAKHEFYIKIDIH